MRSHGANIRAQSTHTRANWGNYTMIMRWSWVFLFQHIVAEFQRVHVTRKGEARNESICCPVGNTDDDLYRL